MAKSKSTATSQDTAAPPTDDDKIRAANRLTDLEFASYQRTIEPPNTERELPFGLKALPIAINSHVQQPNRLYIEVSQYVREQLEAAATKITDQQAEVERLKEEHDWIRTKLGLPLDTPFISGKGDTLAGRMHVVCSNADGYVRYIAAYRCNDKQGEIARQSVELASLRLQLSQAERQRDDLSFLIRDTVANCLTDPGDALSKEIMAGTPDAACDKLTVECDAMEQQLAEMRRALEEVKADSRALAASHSHADTLALQCDALERRLVALREKLGPLLNIVADCGYVYVGHLRLTQENAAECLKLLQPDGQKAE